MIKDQPKHSPEKSLTEKKIWVTPDIQLISGNDILSASHSSNTENAFGGIFVGFYGTNS